MKLKKILFKFIGLLIKLKTRLFKPFSVGARAIVINDKQQVLLLKHTYNDLWYLPGGGINKKETLIDGLKRELKEELNLTFDKLPILLGTYSNFFEHKSDYISIFIIKQYTMNPVKNLEIEKWHFFDLHNLPSTISPGSKKRILEYQKHKEINFIW